jgi:hypothetical protein
MEGFQKFVLFTAIIILIIALVFIGIALSTATSSITWPPMIPECPDYWTIDGSGNAANCINVKDLGTCPPHGNEKHLKMNFNIPAFTGSNELCAKYNWANKCGVTWDGITYGVANPCQTTSSSSSS